MSSCFLKIIPFGVPLACVLTGSIPAIAVAQPTSPATLSPGVGMNAGSWAINQVTETSGTSNRRTITSQACYSAEDVKTPARLLPPQHQAPLKCQNREVKLRGNDIDWRIVCTGAAGSLQGRGRMTVAAETFTASARLESRTGGKSAKIEQTISGERLGDCK